MIEFHRIAQGVNAHTIGNYEPEIAEMVESARAAGLSPVVVDVLSDATEPPVARVRAMAMVWRGISSAKRRTLTAA